MNDLKPGEGPQRRNSPLFWIGLALIALPFLCLVITVISTGHAIRGDAESAFFWLVYLGLIAGIFTVPIGLILFIVGIVQLSRRS